MQSISYRHHVSRPFVRRVQRSICTQRRTLLTTTTHTTRLGVNYCSTSSNQCLDIIHLHQHQPQYNYCRPYSYLHTPTTTNNVHHLNHCRYYHSNPHRPIEHRPQLQLQSLSPFIGQHYNNNNQCSTIDVGRYFRSYSSTTSNPASDSEDESGDFNAATTTNGNTSSTSPFVVVNHAMEYEESMSGRHGRQLSLALAEGAGKDDPPFDPFVDDEILGTNDDDYDNDDDDEMLSDGVVEETKSDTNIVDAEIVHTGNSSNNTTTTSDSNNIDEINDESGYEEDDEESEIEDYDDDDDDDDDDYLVEDRYNVDGSVRRMKSTLATLRAGFPAGGLYAVLELAGCQHKVTTDDLMVVNKLKPVEEYSVGSIHTFTDNILLAGSSHLTLVGMPNVPGAEVDVMVEEITQDSKVVIFKKRRRKNSQRRNGFRRDITLLRVLDVRLPTEFQNHHCVSRDSVDELDEANARAAASAATTAMKGDPSSDSEVVSAA